MLQQARWKVGLGILIAFSLFGLRHSSLAQRRPDAAGQREGRSFDPRDFRPCQVVDPFPAIVNPRHMSAAEAQKTLQPNELVLGIEIDGVARAYPINRLTGPSREIFNDQLGEHSLAATW